MVNVLKRTRASKVVVVVQIFKKARKIENCSEFTMEVMLRKSLLPETTKTQANENFMASKHNFNANFGVFWGNFIKILNKAHGLKCFRDFFEIKHNKILFILAYSQCHTS